MEDESTREPSLESKTYLKCVKVSDWYKYHLVRSGRFAILLFALYITLIAFDVDTLSYERCANLSREAPVIRYLFLAFRSSFVFISILIYYIMANIYGHSLAKLLIAIGAFFILFSLFIKPQASYCIYLRMFVDLPMRSLKNSLSFYYPGRSCREVLHAPSKNAG